MVNAQAPFSLLLLTRESMGRNKIFGSAGHTGGELHGDELDPNLVVWLYVPFCFRHE